MGTRFDIKLVGRGGQGIVTAGELVAEAAFEQGLYAQAIPSFGAERRGGPSLCSLRISDEPILLKCDVRVFDTLVVVDPTIWKHLNAFAGLRPGGRAVMNSTRSPAELAGQIEASAFASSLRDIDLYCIDATAIALETIGRPIPSTAMTGAMLKVLGVPAMEAMEAVVNRKLEKYALQNIAALRKGYAAAGESFLLKGSDGS